MGITLHSSSLCLLMLLGMGSQQSCCYSINSNVCSSRRFALDCSNRCCTQHQQHRGQRQLSAARVDQRLRTPAKLQEQQQQHAMQHQAATPTAGNVALGDVPTLSTAAVIMAAAAGTVSACTSAMRISYAHQPPLQQQPPHQQQPFHQQHQNLVYPAQPQRQPTMLTCPPTETGIIVGQQPSHSVDVPLTGNDQQQQYIAHCLSSIKLLMALAAIQHQQPSDVAANDRLQRPLWCTT